MSSPALVKSGLLSLPDELLLDIVKLATTSTDHFRIHPWAPRPPLDEPSFNPSQSLRTIESPVHAAAVSIAGVCRRLNQIVTPILYRELHVGFQDTIAKTTKFTPYWSNSKCHWYHYHHATPCDVPHELTYWRSFLLQRTLNEKHSLRRFCRLLHISMDLEENHNGLRCHIAARANDLLSSLAHTRHLTIVYTGKPDGTQELEPHLDEGPSPSPIRIKAVLDRGTGGRTSRQLTVACCDMASLRWLASSSMMSKEDQGRANPRKGLKNDPVAPILRGVMPDFASILTALSVSDFQVPEQDSLRDFLRIPECLQHLSLLGCENWRDQTQNNWSLGVFFSMLKPQQTTLKTINLQHVSNFGQPGFGGVDLSSFTSLESLYLYHSDTGVTEEAVEGILQASRLRTFTWNLESDDQQCSEMMNDFRPQYQEAFLRELGTKATARRHPLGHIHIIFRPDPGFLSTHNCPDEYPWDRMNRLGDELGIRVTYDEPTISREEFDRTLGEREGIKKEKRRRNGKGVW
ncbi:hypothetical protein V8F33_013952 [Rhypophila sp. PSN 637]